jgi:phosphoribosylpyrophosphate synthetase
MKVDYVVKQFSSGEYDVKLNGRIYGDTAEVHWNWFAPNERDLMIPLMVADAVRRQYGEAVKLTLIANYLPYARQDRVFEAGNALPIEVLTKLLRGAYHEVRTMGLHCAEGYVGVNQKFNPNSLPRGYNLVFPDVSAKNHYELGSAWVRDGIGCGGISLGRFNIQPQCITIRKVRTNDGIKGQIVDDDSFERVNADTPFLLIDDLVAGGRSFINAAQLLKQQFGESIKVELMVYHAFLDYGVDALKDAGISKIYIINPDSYEYIVGLYPTEVDYFEFVPIENIVRY